MSTNLPEDRSQWEANPWMKWVMGWQGDWAEWKRDNAEVQARILAAIEHQEKWRQHMFTSVEAVERELAFMRAMLGQYKDATHQQYEALQLQNQALALRVTAVETKQNGWAIMQASLALLLSGVGAALGWLLARAK